MGESPLSTKTRFIQHRYALFAGLYTQVYGNWNCLSITFVGCVLVGYRQFNLKYLCQERAADRTLATVFEADNFTFLSSLIFCKRSIYSKANIK